MEIKKDNNKQDLSDLNKEFFNKFDYKFFERKLEYLIYLLSKSEDVISSYKKGISFEKIEFTEEDLKIEDFEKTIKSEVALLYYHSIETLFRIILSMKKWPECPWIGITTITFAGLQDELAKTKKQGLTCEGFDSEDDFIDYLFIGSKCLSNVKKEGIENIKEFLHIFSSDLQDLSEYNAFKHGLAVFPGEQSIKLSELVLADKELGHIYLKAEKDSDGNKVIKRIIRFPRWKEKFGMVIIASKLLQNMISLSKIYYQTEEFNGIQINNFKDLSFAKIRNAALDKKSGICPDIITIEIGKIIDRKSSRKN